MPRTKLHGLTNPDFLPKKGESTGRLRLLTFIMPRSDLQEFQRLLNVGRKTPLTQQLWFRGINDALKELLADLDVALRSGKNVSTSNSEDVRYEGYRKFTRSDARKNIAGERKFYTVCMPVDRKYLFGLPEIKGYNQTFFIDQYMAQRDKPIQSKVEVNSKLVEKLVAIRDKYDIFVRDLIALAIERKSARMRASGIHDDPVAEPIELDTDTNQYKSYGDKFSPEELL